MLYVKIKGTWAAISVNMGNTCDRPTHEGFLPLTSTNYFAITILSFVFSVLINACFISIIIDAGYEDFKKNMVQQWGHGLMVR